MPTRTITTRAALVSLCLLAVVAVLLAGCGTPAQAAQAPTTTSTLYGLTFRITPYNFSAWPDGDNLYYYSGYSPTAGLRDSTGVRVFSYNGKIYQHPVLQAQDGLQALAAYQHTKAAADLDMAEKEANRLIVDRYSFTSITGGAWWFPYQFDFPEYGDATLTAHAPWYSGMAQGEALGLFTDLYTLTHASQWLNAAQHTFASFAYPLRASESPTAHPWVVQVDSGGYLWIEEYPTPNANDDTLNGFGFALYNLMDYARIFRSADAHTLVNGGLTAFAHAVPLARHPGGVSSYSLSHLADRQPEYHQIVTYQLAMFAAATGNDATLSVLALDFYRDYH